jgi:CO/xanthine dehydrogenase FAD-binding subunit
LKSPPFEYARAASVEEACALLSQHGDDAKVIAGGQSLVPMMAFRLLRPAWLIDINEIAALKFVAPEADAVRMGACTRQCDIQRDEALAASVPLLRQALAPPAAAWCMPIRRRSCLWSRKSSTPA